MPLVLTENEVSLSGHEYEDLTGVSYEYPRQYQGMVVPGELFLYYRGRRRLDGSRGPQVYYGSGIIGEVSSSGSGDSLRCSIDGYEPFATDVYFRDKLSGRYLESEVSGRSNHWRRGVRKISVADYVRIVQLGGSLQLSGSEDPQATAELENIRYGHSVEAREVEDFAVKVVNTELASRPIAQSVTVMPRNNPGFDILVSRDADNRYYEVKGTRSALPEFFLTEGERKFSSRNSAVYELVVVFAVDLERGTYRICRHEGEIPQAFLRVNQWKGGLHQPL